MDQKIREAMDQGQFSNLPNSGKPLELRHNPYEPAEMRLSNMMLEANGFAPAWIEDRKELDRAIDDVRQRLARAWETSQGEDSAWIQAVSAVRQQAAELNSRILINNLKTPSPSFQRLQIDIEREIDRATQRR